MSTDARTNGHQQKGFSTGQAPRTRRAPAVAPGARQAKPARTDLDELAAGTLRANSAFNLVCRVLLAVFVLATAGVALVYVATQIDAWTTTAGVAADGATLGERVIAFGVPLLGLVALAAIAALGALAVHHRGIEETSRTLETLSRMRREEQVAVTARGLVVAFEEKLANARRAFTVLLWLGRTLFIVCLVLLAAAICNLILSGADLVTVSFGASSVIGALFAVIRGVPDNVRRQLSDTIRLQTIITGCDRQISLLETTAFKALGNEKLEPEDAYKFVLDVQRRIDKVVAGAVAQIHEVAPEEDDAD